ncbi:hypothetical protein [Verminephrobacter aporrectodeae]|uniref:hypothetical protein n=1 Tax=Verminephrobacter aporrectodeae TaxID=1110389 RepID=UPI000A30EF7F|nr:hypothetical protein [Verminephrobacter aporrectodeae]
MRSAIAAGALERLGQVAQGRPDSAALDEIRFLPVIPNPDKIVCIGHNYEEHRIETRRDKHGCSHSSNKSECRPVRSNRTSSPVIL